MRVWLEPAMANSHVAEPGAASKVAGPTIKVAGLPMVMNASGHSGRIEDMAMAVIPPAFGTAPNPRFLDSKIFDMEVAIASLHESTAVSPPPSRTEEACLSMVLLVMCPRGNHKNLD
jgi:hypothetical protein